MRAAKPALVTYTFAPLTAEEEGPNAERRYLERLWRGWREELGATSPVGDLTDAATEFRWPRKSWNRRLEIVAAAGRAVTPNTSETYQIFLYATHDTAIVIGSLAPNREDDTLDTWTHLNDQWRGIGGDPPEGLLGEARLFIAHLGDPGVFIGQLNELAEPVYDAFPVDGRGRRRWRFNATDRVAFWGTEADSGESRVIAALSPQGDDETTLGELVYWNEHRPYELVPFARYLLNAAKLRFSARVYDREAEERVVKPRDQVDANIGHVMALHSQLAGHEDGSLEEVVEAQDELSRHQAASAGLFEGMTKLRELKYAVEIAARNIELCLPELVREPTREEADVPSEGVGEQAPPQAHDSPFVADLEWAERLTEQFDYDLSFCEAVRARAEEAEKLTRLRVEEAVERSSRVQNRLTVIQSAFIGALLAGLGAIQALSPTIGVADHLRFPLVALVAGVVLAAPLLVLHAYERYQRVDYIAAAVFGAAAGWFAIAAAWGDTPDAWAGLAAAALGAGFVWFLTSQLDRLLTRGRGQSETEDDAAGAGEEEGAGHP